MAHAARPLGESASSLATHASKHVKRTGFPYRSIIDFVTSPTGLKAEIFPAQRFFLKVFEKEPLDDTLRDIAIRDRFNETTLYTLTEHGYYDYLRSEGRFSLDYDAYLANQTVQIILNMGRRASKSTMIGMWVATKLAQLLVHDQPQLYFKILPTDSMNVSLTALGEVNAMKLFDKLASLIKGAPYFQPYLLEPASVSSMKVWTRHDIATMRTKLAKASDAHTNSITITAQSNSPGVRGDNNLFTILEEFAHFNQAQAKKGRDEKQLDEMIYEALSPSVSGFRSPDGMPFGKTLIITSPNGKHGKSYVEYASAFALGVESYTLAMTAPTWEVNPLVAPAFLKKAYNASPTSYDQEYGAKLLEGGMSWLRDLPRFHLCTVKGAPREAVHGRVDRTYYMGVDFALSKDATAVAICHYEPQFREDRETATLDAVAYTDPETLEQYYAVPAVPLGKYVIDFVGERYAGKPPFEDRKKLLIGDMLDWLEHLFRVWPVAGGVYDQWAGDIITELMGARSYGNRLTMVNHTDLINDSLAKLFSEMMHTGRLKLPDDKGLQNGFLALQVEHRPHEIIKVQAPPGAHDDFYSAVTRALWTCHAAITNNFVIAGTKIDLKLGPGVERDVSFATAARDERSYRKLQEMKHATARNLRSPGRMLASARVMAKGFRR